MNTIEQALYIPEEHCGDGNENDDSSYIIESRFFTRESVTLVKIIFLSIFFVLCFISNIVVALCLSLIFFISPNEKLLSGPNVLPTLATLNMIDTILFYILFLVTREMIRKNIYLFSYEKSLIWFIMLEIFNINPHTPQPDISLADLKLKSLHNSN